MLCTLFSWLFVAIFPVCHKRQLNELNEAECEDWEPFIFNSYSDLPTFLCGGAGLVNRL